MILLVFLVNGQIGQVELLPSNAGVQIQHIIHRGFEVACCVIALGDEETVSLAISQGLIHVFHLFDLGYHNLRLTDTNISLTGPRNLRAGWISASGLVVSMLVLIMAM